MMISPNAIDTVSEILDPGDFYRESHTRIYRAALALHARGEPVDAITLTDALEEANHLQDVGGRVRIHELAALVPVSANVGHYARIVKETATLRWFIRAGGELARLGWDRPGELDELKDRARGLLTQLDAGTGLSTTLDLETWAQFERTATETVPTLVDGLWPAGGLGFIAAPPKKGKTWVGLDLAIAVAAGVPFLNHFQVSDPQPVVLVALEGHRAAIRGRIGILARGHGLNPDAGSTDLANLHVLYKPRGLNLSDPGWVRTIRNTVQAVGAKLVIIDVLRRAATMKENSNDEWAELLLKLQPLQENDCSIALLHHFGKLTELSKERSPGERMSGAGAMYGAFDVGVFITRSDDGARKLRVEFETRDLASPEPLGVHLAGTPSGAHGFVYRDTATWQIEEAPAEQDVKAPAAEIAQYVRAQGGDVERRYVEAYFGISDKTLDRRLVHLEELGIDYVAGRGRGAKSRLVARAEDPEDGQITLPIESPTPVSSDSGLSDTSDFASLNHAVGAESPESPESPDSPRSGETKSGDLQGEFSSEYPTSPTERNAPADAAPLTADPWFDDIDPGQVDG
jgi:hypothetical protein